ncbi:MAG: hypothetical protein RL367_595 [Pseudomonadota bacterium]
MVFAMAEIVLEIIAVVFQDVEAFVFNLPAGRGARANLGGWDQRRDERALIGAIALGIFEGHTDPVDEQGVLAIAQWRADEPAIMGG